MKKLTIIFFILFLIIGCSKENKIETYVDGKENNEIITSYDEMIIYKSSPSLRYKIKPVGIPIIESVETDKDIKLIPSDFVIIESNSNMTIKMNSDESITSNFTSNLKMGEEAIMSVTINNDGLKKINDKDLKKINLKLKIKSNLKTGEEAVSYLNTNIKVYNLTLRYILWILCALPISVTSLMYFREKCLENNFLSIFDFLIGDPIIGIMKIILFVIAILVMLFGPIYLFGVLFGVASF